MFQFINIDRLRFSLSPRLALDDPRVDHSLRHSVKDAVAHQVMTGAGESFFSAFALFLKASTAQIAWLASLPPLLGSFAQLLSAWMGRHPGRRKLIIMTGALLQGFAWLPLLSLPLLFPSHAVTVLIACVVIYHAMGHFIAPQWSSLMGDLVPQEQRGRYFAMRTRLASLTQFLSLVCAGLTLHYFDGQGMTTVGFIVIFVVACLARFKSAYHLSCMDDPPHPSAEWQTRSFNQWFKTLHHSPFVRFSMCYALLQCAVSIASPFFTVYLLRDLNYSYLEFMANTTMTVIVQFLTLSMWGRWSDKFGNRFVIIITAIVIPILPTLWLLSEDYRWLLLAQALGGFVWAGFSLCASNYVYDLVPRGKRATYVALHNVLTCIAVFIGAMLGGYLGMIMPAHYSVFGMEIQFTSGLLAVFVISTLARALMVALLIPQLREMRSVMPVNVGQLMFSFVRITKIRESLPVRISAHHLAQDGSAPVQAK